MTLPVAYTPPYSGGFKDEPLETTVVDAAVANAWTQALVDVVAVINAGLGGGMVVVRYYADPTLARPDTTGPVRWIGYATAGQPDNFADGDEIELLDLLEPALPWYARYKSNLIVGADGAALALWGDQSGNGHDLVGTNTTVHAPGGAENRSVAFNGTNGSMQVAFGEEIAQPYTIVLAVKSVIPTVHTDVRIMYDGIANTHRAAVFARGNSSDTGAILRAFAGGSNLDSDIIDDPTNLPRIVSVVFNGAASFMRINGQQVADSIDLGSETLTGLTLGAIFAQTSNFLTGNIYEAAVAQGAMSNNDLGLIEAYMAVVSGAVLSSG